MNERDWVPFHRRLVKGRKRSIRRGVRFVLMELALEARPTHGALDLPLDRTTLNAVHDLLGGNRSEIRKALDLFTIADETGAKTIEIVRETNQHRLVLPKWDEWAGPKPSTIRVREFRNTKRLVANETFHETADETPTVQNITVQDRTGQTTAPQAAPCVGRAKKGARLPEGWSPTPGSYAKVLEETGITEAEALRMVEEFADFWRAVPGQRGSKLDWDATFRNRLREVHGRRRAPTFGKPPVQPAESLGNEVWRRRKAEGS